MSAAPSPTWCCATPAGAVRIFKAPSVPADPSEGVLGVLRLAAQQLDLPLTALLRDCALFVHGSTVATNTILEKKGAKVGMLTTEGFRDSLEIRRGIRENQWDHRAPFPAGPGAALPAPAGARAHRRRRQGAGAAGRRGRRRGRPSCSPTKASNRSPSACSTASSTARTSARRARELAKQLARANGSRCRARSCRPWASTSAARPPWSTPTSHPRSRAISARSTSSCASSACRTRCCCCRATAARSRSTRSRAGR